MNTSKLIPVLALMLATTLALPSCKDDDDPKDSGTTPDTTGTEEISAEDKALDPYGKATEKAMTLYGILNQVSGVDSLPDDWATASFAATIGDKDGEDGALTKTVAAETAAQVIARWNSLTGQNLDTTATSGSWNYDGIGTMSLSVGGDNPFATISIQIPQLQLEKINFVTAAQLGENASTFTPYYEYGDVVKDKDNCYWVCVRPANANKGKKHSHWVSLQMTTDNFKTYKATSSRGKHVVPTKLGNSVENLTYFAELLGVLVDPDNYTDNWFTGGVRKHGLCDLDNDLYTPDYIKALANLWDKRDIWGMVTGSIGKGYFSTQAKNKTLTFFYNGYSSFGVTMTLWTATFSGVSLSTTQASERKWKMANAKFDINDYIETGFAGNNCTIGPIFAVAVRYKEYTGAPDKRASFATDDVLLTSEVQQAAKDITVSATPTVGSVIGANRKFYKTIADAKNDNTNPLGLVVYVDDIGGKNLAMALDELDPDSWSDEEAVSKFGVSTITDVTDLEKIKAASSGSTDGRRLANSTVGNSEAAIKCWAYQAFDQDTTQWFLPSASDVLKTFPNTLFYEAETAAFIYTNVELTRMGYITKYYHNMFRAIDPSYDKGDLETITFWTSTLWKDGNTYTPIRVKISTAGMSFGGSLDFETVKATDERPVRPFMAFQNITTNN